ncbi:MAG: Flp pilus assembly protein CpaB [Deltaproteobacteria bacterium]|nr:Flp pilus assembly protein CpaB [Deltaproteobacteria bacterium]
MFKGKAPLLIAIVLGVLAATLAWYQIRLKEQEKTRGWQIRNVIVARTDLKPGQKLDEERVKLGEMPQRFIYDSVLVPGDMEVATGREVIVPIKRGEPVHWYQLQGIRSLERLSHAVRRRGRAISMEVAERSSVGQMVQPNDHVDVLGTFRDPNSNQMVAVTLLQNVIILATGRATSATQSVQGRDHDAYSTVTLLVLPEEAEIMVLAQELGSLYLALRNREDISIFEERARTTIETLLTGERVKELQKRRYKTIQIIRGLGKGKGR